MEISERIKALNTQLSLVSIRCKSGKLYLRATLPPKPGDGSQPKQYELATKCNASVEGLKIAKAKALEVESLLLRDKFDWTLYLKNKACKQPETVGEWVKRLEKAHWEKTLRNPNKENSFHKDYRSKFNRLPQEEPLTVELLREATLTMSEPETRSRVGFVLAFRRLARFAGLPTDNLSGLDAGYSQSCLNPRRLPSDEEIKRIRSKIENPAWLWVFDLLAIYGIRPHEIFHLNTGGLSEDPPMLEVLKETKTKDRFVYPCRAKDWTEFDPLAVAYPKVKTEGRNNNRLGEVVSREFRNLRIGFTPYDLRHCYARRMFETGFRDSFIAKSMGHSVTVHLSIYRAWWDQSTYHKEYERVMKQQFAADPVES